MFQFINEFSWLAHFHFSVLRYNHLIPIRYFQKKIGSKKIRFKKEVVGRGRYRLKIMSKCVSFQIWSLLYDQFHRKCQFHFQYILNVVVKTCNIAVCNILTYISSIKTWASGDSPLAQLVKELDLCLFLCVVRRL